MKVTTTPHNVPVDLTITLDSKEEATVLYCICNHTVVTDFAKDYGIYLESVREALEKAYPGITRNYGEHWDHLNKSVKGRRS